MGVDLIAIPMPLTFLSAVLFYLSFPNRISMVGFGPCIWFFAIPLLFALRHQPLKKRLKLGFFFGLCAYGLVSQGVISISWAGFMALALIGSIQSVIFAALYRATKYPFIDAIYLSCLWAFSELVRNMLMGGFSFYISQSQAFLPLMLKLYGIIGCFGMSIVIFLVNSLIYLAWLHQKKLPYVSAAVFIFLMVIMAGVIKQRHLDTVHLRVAVIQANISPWEKLNPDLFDRNAQLHLKLTEQAFHQAHPDLVIWPETAFPDDLRQSPPWRSAIFAEAEHYHADMLIGIAPFIDGKDYNSALLINDQGQISGLYHKQDLVPFAENMPLESLGLDWGRGYHISPGHEAGIMSLSSGVRFGIVICSESAHADLVRQLRRSGVQFLVEITNDGWFTDKASYMLHAQAAVMRAVENHMWVVRAANTGFSFAVSPDGVIHTDRNIKLGHEGFGIFDIIINNP